MQNTHRVLKGLEKGEIVLVGGVAFLIWCKSNFYYIWTKIGWLDGSRIMVFIFVKQQEDDETR